MATRTSARLRAIEDFNAGVDSSAPVDPIDVKVRLYTYDVKNVRTNENLDS